MRYGAVVGCVALALVFALGAVSTSGQDASSTDSKPRHQSSLAIGDAFDRDAQQKFLNQLTSNERQRLVMLKSRMVLADATCPLPDDSTQPFYIKLRADMPRTLADELSAVGVSFIGYANPHTHMVRVNDKLSLSEVGTMLRAEPLVAGTVLRRVEDAMSSSVLERLQAGTEPGAYAILFWRDVSTDNAQTVIADSGAILVKEGFGGAIPTATVLADRDSLKLLLESPWVEFVTPDSFNVTTNATSTAMSNADPATIDVSPYNLNGEGQVAGVWDAGVARESHEGYQNLAGTSAPSNWPGSSRVHNVNAVSMHYHAAHVTGTIVGDGTNNATSMGYAPKGLCLVHLWNDVDDERRDAKHSFNHVADNHSYASFGNGSADWGDYDGDAQEKDITNRDILACMFQSAGNYATSKPGGTGAKPFGTSNPTCSVPSANAHRNGFIIAAADDSEDIAGFSSRGPALDGRLVPQFCANGVSLESSDDDADDDYRTLSGTSMSGPSSCGTGVLLSQLWRREHSDQLFSPDIARAVIAQSCRDKYHTGPDYHFGFGIVDCKAAADLILADKAGGGDQIVRGTIRSGEQVDYAFDVSTTDPLHIVLNWLDIWASTGASVTLVNDLDIELHEPGGTIHYPYSGVTTATTNDHDYVFTNTGPNTRDNIELVHVDNPVTGTWTLRVKGTSIPANPQSGVPNDATGFVIASSHSLTTQKLFFDDAVNGAAPVNIPDNSSPGLQRTFNISDPRVVTGVRVITRIHHDRRGDLAITLSSPGGAVTIDLKTANNGFIDGATDVIAVFPDTSQYDDDVAALHCLPVQGVWTVTIEDTINGDTGTLNYLALEFDVRVNNAPVADAGSNITLRENEPGQLDGSATADADGDAVAYSWTQTSGGITLSLSATDVPSPTFNAPTVTQDEVVTFELTATDCSGAFTTDSVQVTIENNLAPVADAGSDFALIEGDNGQFDATSSSDPESDPLTYLWAQTGGAIPIVISSLTSDSPTFTAPAVTQDEQVMFTVTATDDRGDFSTDTVTLTIELNVAPVADAGANFALVWNAPGQLDGSASSDANTGDTLSYQWVQTDGASIITLSNDTDPQPTFTAPAVDDQLSFELTVTDARGLFSTATVTVWINETGAIPKSSGGGGKKDGGGGGCAASGGAAFPFILALLAWRRRRRA